MPATAEQAYGFDAQLLQDMQVIEQQVLVQAVPERYEDYEVRLKAAQFIGACLTSGEASISQVETASTVQPIESLYDAIQLAAEHNDPQARRMIETNVRTDVIERTIKSGHVIEVNLQVDEAGKIQQFGQHMETVQANSLRLMEDAHPEMLARTKAEATNAFRIQECYERGDLDEYCFVVISRAPDNMTREEMADAGFFVDTMSYALQVTTVKDGQLTTESAFLAGVSSPGADRHDAFVVGQLGDRFGVQLAGKTATETVNTPLLVHKSVMPEGVIDLVALCDNISGGFFGEEKPAQDYRQYRAQCREREAMLGPKVDSIVDELIAEAPQIRDRLQATQRLHKLSEKHMVQQAMFDHTIDARVFGPAAQHIEAGRRLFEQGQIEAGLRATRMAERTAISSSCPNGGSRAGNEQDNIATDNKNEDPGDCEFVSKECPKCKAKNVKTVISKGKISGSCGCSAKLK